jgi:hypothetical protein
MAELLIAIVGNVNAGPEYEPASSTDVPQAKRAAEELGAALARQGAKLLVYGGPYLETDVVRGYVAAGPKTDKCIRMWYTAGNAPIKFPEEDNHPGLFERTIETGVDWEVAFYRSITTADGIILMGGNNATKISGQIAIGFKIPIITLSQFGGGAAKVRDTLSVGTDLPTREELALMASPWTKESAVKCVEALVNQYERKKVAEAGLDPTWMLVGTGIFAIALGILAWVIGGSNILIWILFFIPLLGGVTGAVIKQLFLLQRPLTSTAIVRGLIAGGVALVLFITAQITANPGWPGDLTKYATRSIPYAFLIGIVGGITSDTIFLKLSKLDVADTKGIGKN